MKLRERTGFRAVLGVLALLLGISGCTSSDDPTTSPSSTASGPASTSTTVEPSSRPTNVEPPARPPAMDNPDEAGAVAAAEYFLRLTVYAAATGDTSELEAMSGEGCEFCERFVEGVNEVHENGGWVELADVDVTPLDAWPSEETSDSFRVDLEARRAGYFFSSDGNKREYSEEETLAVGFLISPTGQQWIVSDFQTGDVSSYEIGN